MPDHRHAVIERGKQRIEQPADPGPVGRRPHHVARLREEAVHHLDIGEMAEQHAMRMQRALGISGRARGIDDDGGIVARGVDHGEVVGRLLDLAPERFCAAACVADHIDILQVRQPIANFRQLLKTAFVGDDGLGAGVLKAELQRVLAEQREQRHRDETGTERGQMRDRQFQRLRQEHRDAIAAHQSVGLQHIGEAAAVAAQLVERRPLRRAVLVDIDQCEAAGAVGIAVAAGLRDVEPRRDVPAKIAIEFFVRVGLGEHDCELSSSPLPVLTGRGRELGSALAL